MLQRGKNLCDFVASYNVVFKLFFNFFGGGYPARSEIFGYGRNVLITDVVSFYIHAILNDHKHRFLFDAVVLDKFEVFGVFVGGNHSSGNYFLNGVVEFRVFFRIDFSRFCARVSYRKIVYHERIFGDYVENPEFFPIFKNIRH